MQDWPRDGSAYASYMASSEKLYEEALELFENPEPPAEFQSKSQVLNDIKLL